MVVHPIEARKGLKTWNGDGLFVPYEELMIAAKQTQFCERLRVIHPVIFLMTLLTYRSFHLVPTIRELWQHYVRLTGYEGFDNSEVIKYQSFYERFDEYLVDYLKAAVSLAMEKLESNSPWKLHGKLEQFNTVYILDNTLVRLHDKLNLLFPAARTRKPGKSAGFKVSVLFNAVAHGPCSISVFPERTHDIKTFKIGKWVENSLIILDLGFFKMWNFDKIVRYGGSFLIRLKSNSKPIVTKILLPDADSHYNDLIGLPVHEVLGKLPHRPVAMEVRISFRRRKYRNKRGRIDFCNFYCYADYNHTAQRWHTYLTNLSPEEFAIPEICALYAYRWTIELLFKEIKSDNELGQKKSVNEYLSESFIYISILRTIMSREFYSLVSKWLAQISDTTIPPLLWSRIFIEHLPNMASIIRKETIFWFRSSNEWVDLLNELIRCSIPIKRAESRLLQVLQL